MCSRVVVKNIYNNWSQIYLSENHKHDFGYVPIKHLLKISKKIEDWVCVAEQLIGVPYKWGGRDTMGIDCSALLQLSYCNYNDDIPRNTTDQIQINRPLKNHISDLERGSVVFWKGHVATMVDKLNCIHANAFHMKTIVEPLTEVIKRIEKESKIIKMMHFIN